MAIIGLGALVADHAAVRLSSQHEPQKPVDPEVLKREVARYLADRRVAAGKAEVAVHMAWERMGRRKGGKVPFGGKLPRYLQVEEFVARSPQVAGLWRIFEGEEKDPLGDEQFKKVVEVAEELVEEDPSNTPAWFLLAMGLKELGKEKRSLEILQTVNKKEPGLWKAHLEKGILLSDMNKFEEGLDALDLAEALHSSYEVYLNRGIALCFALRFDESEWDLWKTVEVAPHDGNAYYDLAWVHAQRKEPKLTVEMLRYASRDPALFAKRISQETLKGDTFFKPVLNSPIYQTYLSHLPTHDLKVERNWPTLSRFARKRSILDRLFGMTPGPTGDD